jgi:hypothetical protein
MLFILQSEKRITVYNKVKRLEEEANINLFKRYKPQPQYSVSWAEI